MKQTSKRQVQEGTQELVRLARGLKLWADANKIPLGESLEVVRNTLAHVPYTMQILNAALPSCRSNAVDTPCHLTSGFFRGLWTAFGHPGESCRIHRLLWVGTTSVC